MEGMVIFGMAGAQTAVRYALLDMQSAVSHGRYAHFGIDMWKSL